jgi:hypothetical protein
MMTWTESVNQTPLDDGEFVKFNSESLKDSFLAMDRA